ncbi:MAG TPA: MATE family efflux transporter [Sphingomicrobium sp.]|nr:MATE family efflux transporter [Sphingomicrobium sp.]
MAATARLAAPLILAQLTQVAIHTTDVVMLGWLGPDDLAASALAVNLFFLFQVAGMGLVMASAPLIASALGQRSNSVRDVRRSFRATIHLALLFVVPVLLILLSSERILLFLGQDPSLSREAGRYMLVVQWSMIPNLLIIAFRIFLTALGRPGIPLIVSVGGLFVNAALNWMLIFGNWGAPQLGLVGAAVATIITTSLMALALALAIVLLPRIRRFHAFGRFWRADMVRLRAIFRLGLPIALTLAFEISIFSAAIYLMGWIDTASVAAHAIALQIAAIMFMVPLGISQATVIRVGMAYGARNRRWVGQAGSSSLALALAFMTCSAVLMWLFPRELAGLFLDAGDAHSAQVLDLAASFLVVAALFQLFDGGQVIGAAMLRGLQDTRVPMLFALFGYWLVGLGSSYLLAFVVGWRGLGVWVGLALGLAAVAVLMLWRWWRREQLGLVPFVTTAQAELQPAR